MIQMNTVIPLCNDEVPTVTRSHFLTEKPRFKWLCSLRLWLKDQQLKGDGTLAQHTEGTCSLILTFFHQSNTLCKVGKSEFIKDIKVGSWDNDTALVLQLNNEDNNQQADQIFHTALTN